jgi:osmotically-inducible protein OsmY
MAQNRDRNWQERDQQQGGGMGHRGGWQGGEDFGQGERGQHHGSDDSQGRGSWGEGRESYGGWQGGSQGQPAGEWSRMGRYGEEGWQGSGMGGGMGRWGQGGNYRMDRDFGQSGSRGGYGGSFGGAYGGYEGQSGWRPFSGESSYASSRGSLGGGTGGYGSAGGYGSSGYGPGFGRSGYGGSYGQQQGGRGFWDKASDEVSSWFGDDDARRRREQDEHRGRGPKGYTRSDERITEDVNDRMTDDGWLDASDVEVQVSSGEVTLTGQVNSREEKRRAEDIAEAVSGVKHVQNNLRVKSSAGQTTTTQMGSTGTSAGSSATGSTGSKSTTGR